MAANISWLPRSLSFPLPRKKSDDHHLPVTEKQRPLSSGIKHSQSISTASRVTISQNCFREEPTVVHTALSLRGVLEREGFNEKKLTFIVVEGQQQWAREEISSKINAPGRFFAAGEWGPMALPQVCDGGMYFELDIPSLHDSPDPTRLRIYIRIRHRTPSAPASADRLQHTYSYYSRTSYPSTSSPSSTTGPWVTIAILNPHPPPIQKSTSPQNDTSLPTLLKRYYRTNNLPLTTRVTRNPSWILIDLLTLTGNLHGEAWMAEVPGGVPDWSFLFPHDIRGGRGEKWSWMFPGEKESRLHPASQAEKAAVLFGYVDELLGVVRRVEELKSVFERLGGIAQSFDLSPPGQGGPGLGLGGRDHRRRNSYGSASIEEEPSTSTTTISSLGGRNSSNLPPQPPPPRNSYPPPSPTSPTFPNSASSTTTPTTTTTITSSSSSALKAQITTSTTHLAHFLAHLAALHTQAKNLQGMLSASNAIRQRRSLSTLAALGAVLGPVGLVGMVFLMMGFKGGAEGEQGGKGADGWVYPIIAMVVVGIVGVVVGFVRRCGV